jgi:hypothetical protein
MDADKDKDLTKKRKKGEEGQSIFEFVIFLPLLIYFFSILINITSSINASINQQKVLRGFYFHLVRGNSNVPDAADLASLADAGIRNIGYYAFIYRETGSEDDSENFAPCFRMSTALGGNKDETCEDPESDEGSTTFVRVFTSYGICSNTYRVGAGENFEFNFTEKGFNTCQSTK